MAGVASDKPVGLIGGGLNGIPVTGSHLCKSHRRVASEATLPEPVVHSAPVFRSRDVQDHATSARGRAYGPFYIGVVSPFEPLVVDGQVELVGTVAARQKT